MRVIAGKYKGRRLLVPPGLAIRPTTGRLKTCFFGIVQDRLEGSRFLDLCAGCGANGIEALSRGASHVIFVERSNTALSAIRDNLAHCGITSGFTLVGVDMFAALPRLASQQQRFDIIFFDPPYFEDLYTRALTMIDSLNLLANGGLLAADHFKKTPMADHYGTLIRHRQAHQGDAWLSFYAHTPKTARVDDVTAPSE